MQRQKVLIDYMYNKALCNKNLLEAQIELLTECNLRCEHCYLPTHTSSGLGLITIKKLLYELRQNGVLKITFTGGEIFLRNDILEIIKYARDLYLSVSLLSNATCLDENLVKALSKLYISSFSTTIYSMDSNIHDSITNSVGSLNMTLNGLDLLKRYNIPVMVKTPLMKSNKSSIDAISAYCRDMGFLFSYSPIIFSRLDGDNSPRKYRLTSRELSQLIFNVDRQTQEIRIQEMQKHNRASKEFDVLCPAFFYALHINSVGNVYPCTNFPLFLGNIKSSSVSEIWNNSESLKAIHAVKKSNAHICQRCKYQEICEKCPGVALMEQGDFNGCDETAKMVAEAYYMQTCEK